MWLWSELMALSVFPGVQKTPFMCRLLWVMAVPSARGIVSSPITAALPPPSMLDSLPFSRLHRHNGGYPQGLSHPPSAPLRSSQPLVYHRRSATSTTPSSQQTAPGNHPHSSSLTQQHFSDIPVSSSSPPTNTIDFTVPDEVFAKGHMQTVHPALLTVTTANATGRQLQMHAVPVKVLNLNGFDEQSQKPGTDGLLLELAAFPASPRDSSAILPLVADTAGVSHDLTFRHVAGEHYWRTKPLREMKNHVGKDKVTWEGDVQTRTTGDLRRLHRLDRGPLPQRVGEAVMKALESQTDVRVLVRPARGQVQIVQPSAKSTASSNPVLVDQAASSSSSDKKKRKRTPDEPGRRKEDRQYAVLHPRIQYRVELLGQAGCCVVQVAILWAAPGSSEEQLRRQKRMKNYVLIDNTGEHRRLLQTGDEKEATRGEDQLSMQMGRTLGRLRSFPSSCSSPHIPQFRSSDKTTERPTRPSPQLDPCPSIASCPFPSPVPSRPMPFLPPTLVRRH